ncbi:alpha/beta fold hydrolase [Cryobacterium sp. SO2]|uniref:alpha/beta fold hydrolase n=1 Tax=Cryobacterium sp. SO2 TaxID=1897060 RepID=UPI00223D56C9|nr:alpha/beta fold hydrolase [Cryobacterium sp. SO2]WEO76371.1 alpha/beta fold hydrolase [Cryobacterium sp. SO2]
MSDTVLLVHGACHRGSSWRTLRDELDARGIRSVIVDLPSASPALADLHTDASAIRDAVSLHGATTVVCHSYGGMPTTEALVGNTSVERIVYLTAFMPRPGMSLLDLSDDGSDVVEGGDDLWTLSDDGSTIGATNPATLFYNRCAPAVAEAAIRDLAPQSFVSFTQQVTGAAWHTIPATYIVCDDDNAIHPDLQRAMAAQADEVVVLDSDHSPFLSAPARTAALLATLVGR